MADGSTNDKLLEEMMRRADKMEARLQKQETDTVKKTKRVARDMERRMEIVERGHGSMKGISAESFQKLQEKAAICEDKIKELEGSDWMESINVQREAKEAEAKEEDLIKMQRLLDEGEKEKVKILQEFQKLKEMLDKSGASKQASILEGKYSEKLSKVEGLADNLANQLSTLELKASPGGAATTSIVTTARSADGGGIQKAIEDMTAKAAAVDEKATGLESQVSSLEAAQKNGSVSADNKLSGENEAAMKKELYEQARRLDKQAELIEKKLSLFDKAPATVATVANASDEKYVEKINVLEKLAEGLQQELAGLHESQGGGSLSLESTTSQTSTAVTTAEKAKALDSYATQLERRVAIMEQAAAEKAAAPQARGLDATVQALEQKLAMFEQVAGGKQIAAPAPRAAAPVPQASEIKGIDNEAKYIEKINALETLSESLAKELADLQGGGLAPVAAIEAPSDFIKQKESLEQEILMLRDKLARFETEKQSAGPDPIQIREMESLKIQLSQESAKSNLLTFQLQQKTQEIDQLSLAVQQVKQDGAGREDQASRLQQKELQIQHQASLLQQREAQIKDHELLMRQKEAQIQELQVLSRSVPAPAPPAPDPGYLLQQKEAEMQKLQQAEMQKLTADFNDRIRQKEFQCQELSGQIAVLQAAQAANAVPAENPEQTLRLRQQEEQIQKLSMEVLQGSALVQQKENEKNAMQSQVIDLRTAKQELETKIYVLGTEKQTLSQEIQTLTLRLQSKSQEGTDIVAQLERAQRAMEGLNIEMQTLKQQNQNLIADVETSQALSLAVNVRLQDAYASCAGQIYLVDNSKLQADTKGLNYRASKQIADKIALLAPWGCLVPGQDENDGWLRVGQFYLPFNVDDVAVLSGALNLGSEVQTLEIIEKLTGFVADTQESFLTQLAIDAVCVAEAAQQVIEKPVKMAVAENVRTPVNIIPDRIIPEATPTVVYSRNPVETVTTASVARPTTPNSSAQGGYFADFLAGKLVNQAPAQIAVVGRTGSNLPPVQPSQAVEYAPAVASTVQTAAVMQPLQQPQAIEYVAPSPVPGYQRPASTATRLPGSLTVAPMVKAGAPTQRYPYPFPGSAGANLMPAAGSRVTPSVPSMAAATPLHYRR